MARVDEHKARMIPASRQPFFEHWGKVPDIASNQNVSMLDGITKLFLVGRAI